MWVPIALSRDVPEGVTRAVVIEGEERVIWRAEDGAVQVWEDRCPHRGMRLSLGFVRGGALNCLYHGWTYGSDARCTRIPAHPDLKVPPSIKANAFPAREAGGMILTELGGGGGSAIVRGAAPVASFAVEAPAAAILARIDGEPIAGHQIVIATLGGLELNIGWHIVSATKTMLHTALRGAGEIGHALAVLRALRAELEGAIAA
jgi:nitrite reductase/ring-hydroxylating ferredoxin subunit